MDEQVGVGVYDIFIPNSLWIITSSLDWPELSNYHKQSTRNKKELAVFLFSK